MSTRRQAENSNPIRYKSDLAMCPIAIRFIRRMTAATERHVCRAIDGFAGATNYFDGASDK